MVPEYVWITLTVCTSLLTFGVFFVLGDLSKYIRTKRRML